MGPILPLRSELPIRYIQGLKAYTTERRRRAERRSDEEEQDRLESWETFLDDLVKQAMGKRDEDKSRRTSSAATTQTTHKEVEIVRIHPPHLTPTGGPAPGSHNSLLRQGPVIYNPGPQETEDDVEENVASDLILLCMPRDEGAEFEDEDESDKMTTSAVGIAWSSGRVDIGMIVDAPEPAWVEKDVGLASNSHIIYLARGTNGQARFEATPTIPILESIYLDSPRSSEDSEPAPSCLVDTLYPDTFYVHGPGGVGRINVRPIIDAALHGDEDQVESDVSMVVSTDG